MESDLTELLLPYTQLYGNTMPEDTAAMRALWRGITSDPSYHIIVAEKNGELTASCVLVIVPNLMHGQRLMRWWKM